MDFARQSLVDLCTRLLFLPSPLELCLVISVLPAERAFHRPRPLLGGFVHPGAAWPWPSHPGSCVLEDAWKTPQIHKERRVPLLLLEEVLLGEIRESLICTTTGRTSVRLLQVRSHLLEAKPARAEPPPVE